MDRAVLLVLLAMCWQASAMPIRIWPPGMEPHERNFTGKPPSNSLMGVDVSQPTSKSAFECLVEKGYKFAIVRAYLSIGEVDTAAPATITNALAAGMEHVDVYLFPCFHCGNAAGQVRSMVEYLSDHSSRYGMIWLDVEGHWGTESESQEFFRDLLEESRRHKSTGVYTSQYMWGSIMGSSYTGGSSEPLWYAHYDDNPSFSDFEPFGGWSRPSVKQYRGNAFVCGAGVDENWEP